MTDDYSSKCFRCEAKPKILMNFEINQSTIKLCPRCLADFGLFIQGHAVHSNILVKGESYVRKEEVE